MATRPNVIFILADDLGYADLGCYGGREPVSPNLDRMAEEGLKFLNGYANSPVCSPTRFALMTGRYQYHFRGAADEPLHGPNALLSTHGLPPSHQTLPSALKKQGYRTALIGKWHLGSEPHFGPRKSGYDEHFGLMSGGIDYFTHTAPNGKKDLWHNGTAVDDDTYLTDLLSDRAVDFIQRSAKSAQPFLLSLHYTAPHWPWETREDHELAKTLVGKTFHLDGGSVKTYQTMIHHMDEGIGRIMAELKRLSLDDNTLVVFTSDNGGERFSDSWPLVGGKMDLTEGGIRVPYIVRWPNVVPASTTSNQMIMTMDWMPTILDAANASADPAFGLDGISLLEHLQDPSKQFERELFWRMKYREQKAFRTENWKYLSVDGNEYLFNLAADARERANQSLNQPARLAEMRARFDSWQASIPSIPDDASVTLVYTKQNMP
jgi:arylsulfatase A-like enzyme